MSALVGPSGHQQRVGSSFTITELAHYHFTPMSTKAPAAKPGMVQSFVSQPNLKPPTVSVITDTPPASPDDVFIAANGSYPQRGPMIFNRAGQLVWFKPIPTGKAAMDLQVERYDGAPVLVWWQGYIGLGVGFGTDEIYGQNYQRIASVNAGNGYQADLHDIQITPSGAAFITAYSIVEANLSSVGGADAGRAAGRDRAGGRRQDRAGDVRVARLRARRARRLLLAAPRLAGDPVGLLPRQLDLARPLGRRQLPDLGAQHVGGV